jgi:hypothetical protein
MAFVTHQADYYHRPVAGTFFKLLQPGFGQHIRNHFIGYQAGIGFIPSATKVNYGIFFYPGNLLGVTTGLKSQGGYY